MTLKEKRKKIKELLIAKEKGKLIGILVECFDNEELGKEFEDKVPENCDNNTLQGEEFEVLKDNNKYLASNLGRIRLNKGNKPVIPQRSIKDNWYLNADEFRKKYTDFEGICIAGEALVYDYFMKETSWLKDEYNEIKKIYKDCFCGDECNLELHHINRWGDNRIDNMIYIPACIHREVHSKKSS